MRARTLARLLLGGTLGWLAGRAGAAAAVDTVPPPAAAPAPRPACRFRVAVLGVLLLLGAAGAAVPSWLQRRQDAELARAITGGEPDRAPELLIRYGCGGCHAIPGVPGADGRVAAPLGGLRERVYVGGVARNTADNLVAWIVDPRALSPRSAMPATGITPAEARDVAAYLYAH
jgi:cytochrome c1